MGRLIPLIAKSQDGQAFSTPKVVYVNDANIKVFAPDDSSTATTKVHETLPSGHKTIYEVYEKAIEIEAQRSPSTTDLIVKQVVQAGVSGAGTTQGAGTAVTRYFIEATTLTAASAEAVTLDAATVGEVKCIVNNHATAALKIFPASGEFINASTKYSNTGLVNAVLSLPAGKRVHLVCLVAGKWTVATDNGSR